MDDLPIASGRDADVYALDKSRVLRRYRRGGDVESEAAMMAYAAAHGFPVPRVYSAVGPDLILQRLSGRTMREAFEAEQLDLAEGAAILADLHRRLHELPAPSGAPDKCLVHLDLHPENVVMTDAGPVLIDWRNSTEDTPDLDLAMTALILAEVGVDPGLAVAPAAHVLLKDFLLRAGGDPLGQLDRAVALRRSDPHTTPGALARMDDAARLVRVSAAP